MEEHNQARKRIPGWVKIVIAVILTFAVTVGGAVMLLGNSGIALVQGYLLSRYAFVEEDADVGAAVDEALTGLVTGLGDRWSYYLDPASYQATLSSRANNYVGIGITVSFEREEGILVTEVTPDGPAQKAGVTVGDVITQVSGTPVAGEARYDATQLIMGEVDTQVELTLLGDDGSSRTVTCTRSMLKTYSAHGTLLEDNVGYVRLDNFYQDASESFRQEVEKLREDGATRLVLDVRSNPGGYITELVEILDYLLPEGPIFMERPRWGQETVYRSDENHVDLPMVVMVNKDSYSAAELFAAQLRESAHIPIVGEVTSGKGYAQVTFPLKNGGGMGISVASYCTGGGHSLIGEGITPDVKCSLDTEQKVDNQLESALELLK